VLCSDIQHHALFTLVLQSIEKPEKIAKGGFKTGDGSSKDEEEEDAVVDGDGHRRCHGGLSDTGDAIQGQCFLIYNQSISISVGDNIYNCLFIYTCK